MLFPRRQLLREFRYFQLPAASFFGNASGSTSLSRVYAVGGSTDAHGMHRPVSTVMCYDTQFDGWCVVVISYPLA